jgi:hypothetical protein
MLRYGSYSSAANSFSGVTQNMISPRCCRRRAQIGDPSYVDPPNESDEGERAIVGAVPKMITQFYV